MIRFFTLLKKEVRELLTPQMILPMLIGVLALAFIGNIVGSEGKKSQTGHSVSILDLDKTDSSGLVNKIFTESGFTVDYNTDLTAEQIIKKATDEKTGTVLIIPEGFEDGMGKLEQQKILKHSVISNFSIFATTGSAAVDLTISAVNEYFSNLMMSRSIPGEDPAVLKNPVVTDKYVSLKEKTAHISIDEVTGFITTQTMFIPIVIFMIIVSASQMIAVTIASEKENKTLETLLSTPVSRISIVTAKMTAAGLVSLLMAIAYMFGMNYYINGLTGGAFSSSGDSSISSAITRLGLTLSIPDYALIGISLFLSILIALAISLILGAFAEDVKKAQGLITPILFLIMIPYLMSMFIDVGTSSTGIKLLMYAIPFSHTFSASQNLFLQNYQPVIFGIIYQSVWVIALVIIAAKIFKSDKILTMKINFSKKSLTKIRMF